MEEYVGELAALATALLWTLSILAWTSAGQKIGALAVSFIRLLVASVFLAITSQATRGLALPLDASPQTWWCLGMSGLFGLCLADICLFKACLVIGPRLTLLVSALSPPLAAILSNVWLGDALNWRHWVGMAITLAGICWVVLEQPQTDGTHPQARRQWTYGIVLALLAAVGQAIGGVFAKQGIGNYDAFAATFIRTIGALGGYTILITLLRRWPAMGSAIRNGPAMRIVSFGSFVGPFAGVALYMVALRHCHVGVVVTITYMMPVMILPFSVFLHHEKVTLRAMVGAVISVVGIAVMSCR
jgi:drug/metabolite transporter (DMT)-like permease